MSLISKTKCSCTQANIGVSDISSAVSGKYFLRVGRYPPYAVGTRQDLGSLAAWLQSVGNSLPTGTGFAPWEVAATNIMCQLGVWSNALNELNGGRK